MDLSKIGYRINRTAPYTICPLAFVMFGALRIARYFMRRSGPIARLLRYPNPLKRPWNGPTIDIMPTSGLGDTLMCTPALRELKRRNPHCYIRFYTEFGPLVNGLPYIDEVLPYDRKPPGVLEMTYAHAVPPEVPCHGLRPASRARVRADAHRGGRRNTPVTICGGYESPRGTEQPMGLNSFSRICPVPPAGCASRVPSV